jgi:SAM-dependent methyltransferase
MNIQPHSSKTFAKTLQAENDAFYKRVKAAYQASDHSAHLPLNLFWGGENMTLLSQIIGNDHSPEEKTREILATGLYSHGALDSEVIERQVEWWLHHLQQHYGIGWERIPKALQESAFTSPTMQVLHEGRQLSPDFLRHFTLALEVQRRCLIPEGPVNVLELGAGYGGFARIFKLFRPNASYVLVDIPETLYFSSLFLRQNFPDAKVHYVTEMPKSHLDISQYDFVFVPTIYAEAVLGNRFDLFYNTCSLGEMKNAVIRYWMKFIQEQLEVRYFFGVNRYLNTIEPQTHSFRLEENEASVSFDAHWRIVQWELEPPFTRCPYHETFATRNLQVVAERLPREARSPQANRQEAERMVARLSKQDWLVYAGADNAMRLRDNFLVHDLGPTGILFQLWEAIRLRPSVENVSMMLVYLYQLRRERPFEEMFYYLDRLETLRRDAARAVSSLPETCSPDLLNRQTMTQVWGIRRTPELVESGYQGFNLVRYQSKVFAIALALGHVNLTQLGDKDRRDFCVAHRMFIGESLDEVKKAIDGFAGRSVPRLVKQNYRGFNFVEYGDKVYALSLALGPVNFGILTPKTLAEWQASRKAYIAASVSELTGLVDGGANGAAVPVPESAPHPEYRVAPHNGLWHAIPKRLGSLNLAQPGERNLPEVLSARNPQALNVAMDQAQRPGSSPSPQLLEHDDKGLQIFSLEGLFLAADSARGGLNLEHVRGRRNGHVFAALTLPELKRKVKASRDGARPERLERTLVIGANSPQRTREIIQQAGCQNVTVLAPDPQQALGEWPSIVAPAISPEVLAKLHAAQYELVVVPYGPRLDGVAWESLVAPFCQRLLAVFPDGSSRLYEGDHFSRALYNMAYLRSMYRQVPSLTGQRVLEVGCSDGLTCNLIAQERPTAVVGVDQLETVGLLYPNPCCTYQKLDATTLPFEDGTFDMAYSIATFEHVADPLATLKSMRRVLRPGGYGYVQAAPLYYSPFGHHMFGFFDHYPWVHILLSKTEIAEYARANGVAARIEATHDGSAEEYINGMINLHQVNGKLLHEYRFQEFAALPGVEVVSFTPSYEGENLLTPDILAEAAPVRREDLIAHGFELVFRAK